MEVLPGLVDAALGSGWDLGLSLAMERGIVH